MGTRTRIAEYDSMRAVGIAAVVLIHVTAVGLSGEFGVASDAPWLLYANRLARFAVPAFVFISCALYWSRPQFVSVREYVSFMGGRFAALLPPYLLWAAVYLALRTVAPGPHAGTAFTGSAGDTILAVVGGKPWLHLYWFHLYFVPLILQLYVLTPVFRFVVAKAPELGFALGWAGAALAAPLLYRQEPDTQVLLFLVLYLPYALAGGWYARRRDVLPDIVRKAWPLLVAIGFLTLLYREQATSDSGRWILDKLLESGAIVVLLLGIVLGARWLTERWPDLRTRAEALVPLVYGAYLSHVTLIGAVWWVVWRMDALALWGNPAFVLGAWVVVLVLSVAAVASLRRWPVTRWMV